MFIESNKCIYSPRLGTLSPAQLQAMLDRFELGRLVYAEPIESGFSKQNVFVTIRP